MLCLVALTYTSVFVTCHNFMAMQKTTPTASSPYDCMQDDVLEFQGRGAQFLVCGDLNARTAEEPGFVRTAELQPFLPIAPDDDELYISPKTVTRLLQGPITGVLSYWGFASRIIFLFLV